MVRLAVEGHLDRELLRGVIDSHLHLMPGPFQRPFADDEAAQLAREAGMRGFVIKDHHTPTPMRAEALRQRYPGFDAFGSVVLNHPVGGVNPHAVDSQARYGARVVWFPTVHARNHLEVLGAATFPGYSAGATVEAEPIYILDDRGRLVQEARDVCDLCVDRGLCIATGHIDGPERLALVEYAVGVGSRKLVVTHANWAQMSHLDLEGMQALVDAGALIEFCLYLSKWHQEPPDVLAARIATLGPQNVVLSTDGSNVWSPSPPEHFRMLISILLSEGVSAEDIRQMTVANPLRILGLDG